MSEPPHYPIQQPQPQHQQPQQHQPQHRHHQPHQSQHEPQYQHQQPLQGQHHQQSLQGQHQHQQPPSSSPAQASAIQYLQTLLTKNLRVLATDGRLFIGQLKCTDPDSNIILAHTYEFRHPSGATPTLGSDSPRGGSSSLGIAVSPLPPPSSNSSSSLAGMKSRYLGLVVVPGKHIVKMELEEFASQMRRPQQQQQQQTPQTRMMQHQLLPQQQPPPDFGGVI